MLAKDTIASRLDTGISFTEFSYIINSRIRFLNHLYDHYDLRIQVGGSDQWGNITTGLEVIRKQMKMQKHTELRFHSLQKQMVQSLVKQLAALFG